MDYEIVRPCPHDECSGTVKVHVKMQERYEYTGKPHGSIYVTCNADDFHGWNGEYHAKNTDSVKDMISCTLRQERLEGQAEEVLEPGEFIYTGDDSGDIIDRYRYEGICRCGSEAEWYIIIDDGAWFARKPCTNPRYTCPDCEITWHISWSCSEWKKLYPSVRERLQRYGYMLVDGPLCL